MNDPTLLPAGFHPQLEEWRPVLGHEGAYEVSNQGRVRSLDRRAWNGHVWHRRRGKVLAPQSKPDGHPTVSLSADGRYRTRLIHHLVLEAFVGPAAGRIARHLNDVPDDNRSANLAWGTLRENSADMRRNGGRASAPRRTQCPRRHQLVEPNLVPGALAKGRRQCRACSQARAAAQRRGITFSDELADVKYQALLGG